MDWVRFDGELKMGSRGQLKMKNGPEVPLVVTSFSPPNSYTDEFTMMGSKFIFHHELSELSATTVSVRIRVETLGLFADLLAPLMKSDMSRKMPVLMNNFKQQFERDHPQIQ